MTTVSMRWLAALAMCVAVLVGPPPARADTHGDCNASSGCKPDSADHSYCFLPSTYGTENDALRDSMTWSMNNLAAQTDMTVSHPACDGGTDVKWARTDLENYVLAQWHCLSWVGTTCYTATNRIDIEEHYRIGNDPDNIVDSSDGVMEAGELDLNRDISACHELGHSVGLAHHDRSWYYDNNEVYDCQRNDWLEPYAGQNDWKRYSPHHVGHINTDSP